MTTTPIEAESICCPPFNPAQWDGKMLEWENKKFVRDTVFTFFYMPLNFGKVMTRLDRKLRDAGAAMQDYLALSDHKSKWKMDIYLAVDREVEGIENTSMSGRFYSKVYEGPFSDTSKWCSEYQGDIRSKGMEVKKWFMWYTTCPKCAKKYGKNYVAIVSRVE